MGNALPFVLWSRQNEDKLPTEREVDHLILVGKTVHIGDYVLCKDGNECNGHIWFHTSENEEILVKFDKHPFARKDGTDIPIKELYTSPPRKFVIQNIHRQLILNSKKYAIEYYIITTKTGEEIVLRATGFFIPNV